MVEATTDGNKIYVTCESFSDKDLVGMVAGAKWRGDSGHWVLPLTWSAAKQLRSLFGDSLKLSDPLIRWGTEELENRINPCMELRDRLYMEDSSLDPRLRPYQVAGAHFLATAKGALLGDQCGSGKGAQAISAARLLGALPALVITPKSVMESWKREIEMWAPGTSTYVISGSKKQRSKIFSDASQTLGIYIINWESLRLHSRLAPYGSMRLSEEERTPKELNHIPFRLIIGDELQRAAKISKAARALWAVGDMPSVEYRWGLTGTPLTNNIDTLWPILRFLNKEEWPSKVSFIDRYAITRPVPWGSGSEVVGINPANEEEFQEIFQPRFRRMPKEIILPQLPPITRTRRYLEMSPSQRRCYDEMAEDMVAETESGELLIAANPAVKMLRMIQFSSATVDMIPRDPYGNDEDGEMVARLVDPSNKLDALMEDLPDLLSAEESVVVFAVSRQLIEMAEERLNRAKINYSVIKGGQTSTFRQSQIDAFQNGETPVILVVVAAGGTGVNLFKGRIAIFLQRAWDFLSNHQCEGRLHRIGSEIHDSISIIDYISRGTVDEHVIQVAEGKEMRLEQLVRDREAIRRILSGREVAA